MQPQEKRELLAGKAWDWAVWAEWAFDRLPFYEPEGDRARGPESLGVKLFHWGRKSEEAR